MISRQAKNSYIADDSLELLCIHCTCKTCIFHMPFWISKSWYLRENKGATNIIVKIKVSISSASKTTKIKCAKII